MPTIEHQTHIDATAQEVWEVLADLGSFAAWSPVVREVEHDGRAGIGATRSCRVVPVGRLDEEVVAWEPGRRIALRVTGGMPMDATATWSVTRDGAGTRARVVLEYQLRGGPLGRVMERAFVHRQLDRNFAANLEGLRDHVERTAAAAGEPRTDEATR